MDKQTNIDFRVLRPLGYPFLTLVTLVVALDMLHGKPQTFPLGIQWIFKGGEIAAWAAAAVFIIRLIDIALQFWMAGQPGGAAPFLIKELLAGFIWFGALCGVTASVFGQSLTALLTTSTVIMGVIGFALQRPIMDAFAAIVLGLQRPFQVGDWIQIDDKHPTPGRVTEMTWRAVRLVTADEITWLVPNNELVNKPIKIFTRPEPFFRDSIQITLPFNVTAYRAHRILASAATQVEEFSAIPRKASVSVVEYNDSGILWRLMYWCPDGRLALWRYKIHQAVLRNLHFAGVTVPVPMRAFQTCETWPHEMEEASDREKLLARVPLFTLLTKDELKYLAGQCAERLCLTGDTILRQGAPGDSLFVVKEGSLVVTVTDHDGKQKEVGRLRPGHFFGERSLLVGEPRGATVSPLVDSIVIEMGREAIAPLMQDRPEIVEYLSEILGEREAANRARLRKSEEPDMEEAYSLAKQLLKRIRIFFGLPAMA